MIQIGLTFIEMEERYFYCYDCAYVWRDDETFLHDIQCPDCMSEFLDGKIGKQTKIPFGRIVKGKIIVIL